MADAQDTHQPQAQGGGLADYSLSGRQTSRQRIIHIEEVAIRLYAMACTLDSEKLQALSAKRLFVNNLESSERACPVAADLHAETRITLQSGGVSYAS
jgi:hypothetical protein